MEQKHLIKYPFPLVLYSLVSLFLLPSSSNISGFISRVPLSTTKTTPSPIFLSRSFRIRTFLLSSKSDSLDDDDDEAGKFLELGKEVSQAYGPLGLIIAGYEEEHLDLIVHACEEAYKNYAIAAEKDILVPLPHIPITILGKSDLGRTFQDVLAELDERDCVIPADGDEIVLPSSSRKDDAAMILRFPLVLFSGFEIPVMQQSIRYVQSMSDRLPMQPMVAMAVPNAMEKEICQLLEEIEGDHTESQAQFQEQR